MTDDHHHPPEHHEHGRALGTKLHSLLHAHHHDHLERVDRALEASAEGIRAVKISLVGLSLTSILQLVVVAMSGSVALLRAIPCTTSAMLSLRCPCGSRSASAAAPGMTVTPTVTDGPRTWPASLWS